MSKKEERLLPQSTKKYKGFEMKNSDTNPMVTVKVASKELGKSKSEIKDLIRKNLIDWKLKNGSYVVDINSIKEEKTFNNSVEIPKLIKQIFSETLKDFSSNPNISGSEMCKVFKRVSKSNSLNIMDGAEIFEYAYHTAVDFQKTENINYNELLNNFTHEYKKIYTESQRRFKIDRFDKSVVSAEHFIMICFIKLNFNIISMIDTEFEWLNR